MLIVLVLVSHFNFLFVPCGELSWLPVSFLLQVKYTVSYRIVKQVLRMHYGVYYGVWPQRNEQHSCAHKLYDFDNKNVKQKTRHLLIEKTLECVHDSSIYRYG